MYPVNGVSGIKPVAKEPLRTVAESGGSSISFKSLLSDKLFENEALSFSKHASVRLNSRNISLSTEQLSRIDKGLATAKQKGINDSLVMVDDIRLVVNVRSKTVITAMNRDTENVFTNIDGAIIV